MRNFVLFLICFLGLITTAQAGELTYGYGGKAQGFYGHTDANYKYKSNNNYNKFYGYAELNLYAEYEYDQDTSFGLYLDLMKNFNRSSRALNNGSWGKEAYAIMDSKYGRIMLGETYNVAHQFHQGQENFLHMTSYLTNPNWDRKENRARFTSLNSTAINTDGVAPKITYISPDYQGTTIGFSYINDINNRRGLANKKLSYSDNDGYVVSLYHEHDFNYFDAYTSVSYADFRDNDKEYSASIKLARGNWSLSSGYRKAYIDGKKDAISPDFSDNYREGYAWDAGIGYEIGPFASSLTYFYSKADNTKNKNELISFTNKYQYNKWVDIYLGVGHLRYVGEQGSSLNKNNKGWMFMTGIGLNF